MHVVFVLTSSISFLSFSCLVELNIAICMVIDEHRMFLVTRTSAALYGEQVSCELLDTTRLVEN